MKNILVVLACTIIIFFGNCVGSLSVFIFKKKINSALNACIYSLASGIMLSVCIFGLFFPAYEMAGGLASKFMIVGGFLLGNLFVQIGKLIAAKFGKQTAGHHLSFLLTATIHNIPEGLILGLSLGSAIIFKSYNFYLSAIVLSCCIAVQNVPESMAVCLTLKNDMGNKKAFGCTLLCGAIEPVFALLGIFMKKINQTLFPFCLAFAAGIVIYVIIYNILPNFIKFQQKQLCNACFTFGFLLMMIIEIFCKTA